MGATAHVKLGSARSDPGPACAAEPQSGYDSKQTTLRGWALLSRCRAEERRSEDLQAIARQAILTRGAGRAYGDAALPPACSSAPVACSLQARRILDFDPKLGIVRTEAGVTVAQLAETFLPLGWFLPVTPGTAFATVGGLVAADVHGKNHRVAGTFGRHLRNLRIFTGRGELVDASRHENPDLFCAVQGGLGLAGHILEASFQLEKIPGPWLDTQMLRARDLDDLLDGLEGSEGRWPFHLAWADVAAGGRRFGRGIVDRGRWTDPPHASAVAPRARSRLLPTLRLPHGVINRATVRAANAARFRLASSSEVRRRSPYSFFYPLEQRVHLNGVYGPAGFVHHHCALPPERRLVQRYLELFRRIGGSAWLCALKRFGPTGEGLLSFPFDGYSIALEFPARGAHARSMVDALNAFVADSGGRIYLVKDALSRPDHVRAMYPRIDEWQQIRRRWDPDLRIRSALSTRILGDEPG